MCWPELCSWLHTRRCPPVAETKAGLSKLLRYLECCLMRETSEQRVQRHWGRVEPQRCHKDHGKYEKNMERLKKNEPLESVRG